MTTIQDLYAIFLAYPTVCTDTRKLSPNCLFFALKGDNFNGNAFAQKAIAEGAAYAIIDEAQETSNHKFILVEDVLASLQQLATWHRKQLNIPVIAIVGSNGKTSTKELISAVLTQKYHTLSTPGNFNNHIGLPLTLLMLEKHHEVAVIEMGANHEEENKLLCEIAQPTHGLITNNGKDHLEGFGSLEGVIRSNAELYDYFITKQTGIVFVNAADTVLMFGSNQIKKRITYSANPEVTANFTATDISLQPNINFQLNDIGFSSKLSGDYNLENIMAAVAIGFHFEVVAEGIVRGIAGYTAKNLRSEYFETERNKIFLDAYNANPSSMMASIKNFVAMPAEKKLLILGDMFELGSYEAEEHQNLVDFCQSLGLKNVWLIGKAFANTQTHFLKFADSETLKVQQDLKALTQQSIFLKGSRGMKLERLVEYL